MARHLSTWVRGGTETFFVGIWRFSYCHPCCRSTVHRPHYYVPPGITCTPEKQGTLWRPPVGKGVAEWGHSAPHLPKSSPPRPRCLRLQLSQHPSFLQRTWQPDLIPVLIVPGRQYTTLQKQTAVSANLKSKHLLLFAFALQYSHTVNKDCTHRAGFV